jgi:hypothetical protein
MVTCAQQRQENAWALRVALVLPSRLSGNAAAATGRLGKRARSWHVLNTNYHSLPLITMRYEFAKLFAVLPVFRPWLGRPALELFSAFLLFSFQRFSPNRLKAPQIVSNTRFSREKLCVKKGVHSLKLSQTGVKPSQRSLKILKFETDRGVEERPFPALSVHSFHSLPSSRVARLFAATRARRPRPGAENCPTIPMTPQ